MRALLSLRGHVRVHHGLASHNRRVGCAQIEAMEFHLRTASSEASATEVFQWASMLSPEWYAHTRLSVLSVWRRSVVSSVVCVLEKRCAF
jgi:hypothetical protein